MKKLHSFVLYALVTPAITLGAGSVLAQPSDAQDPDREQQSTQPDQDARPSSPETTQGDQSTRAGQPGSQSAADRVGAGDDQSRAESRGYLSSAPANGMQISDLMDAEVRTNDDEDVGSVSDLIIDENGQVVAIVVGVGGFLGMGEKDVAIGWDDVTTSGASDEQELRIESTRDELRDAPEFERRD